MVSKAEEEGGSRFSNGRKIKMESAAVDEVPNRICELGAYEVRLKNRISEIVKPL